MNTPVPAPPGSSPDAASVAQARAWKSLRLWIAVHCVLLATAVCVFALAWRGWGSADDTSGAIASISIEEVRELEAKLARLESRIETQRTDRRMASAVSETDESRRSLGEASATARSDAAELTAVHAPTLLESGQTLEKLRALAEASIPFPSGALKDPAKLAEVHELFADTTRSDAERATALMILRRELANGLDVGDAFPSAVVENATWLLQNSRDSQARRVAASALRPVRSDRLRGIWLDTLRSDQDPRMRETAAKNLLLYSDDPRVQDALRDAERYDEDSEVRNNAGKAQGGR